MPAPVALATPAISVLDEPRVDAGSCACLDWRVAGLQTDTDLGGSKESTAELISGDGGAAPGARFGRFVVVGALGRGGMGVVLSAFDPELKRKVALKLLSREHAGAPLLAREAQALASLAHPNVVAVYEAVHVDDQRFIAMELVDGTTLRAWLAEPRRWREIVAMFVAAGRGLSAAHAVGITHRDFKPDNVLVGRDGRPRVSDFGLATRTLGRAVELDAGAALDASTCSAGVPVGTPAYMAPEQWTGDAVDARTDQFAFAVALWSALYGERPFAGHTAARLRTEVVEGRLRAPAHPDRAPRWLVPVLTRALAVDPARRWPALDALLDQLERRAAARWRGLAIAGGLAVLGAAAVIAARPAADPCAPPDARIAEVWGSARRAVVAQHAVAVDPSSGAQRFAAAASALDPAVAAWRAMHVAACRATRVERAQSDQVLDLRMRCLTDWLTASERAVAGFATATSSTALEGALRAISDRPRLERCADAQALATTVPEPSAPAERAESAAILAEIDAIATPLQRGETAGLAARTERAVARARRLGHPYTLSRALGSQARVAAVEAQTELAVAVLRELVEVAARARDHEEAAHAWASLIRLVALGQGHAAEARSMFLAADSAAARVTDRIDLRADLMTSEATALVENGEVDAAFAKLAETRRMLEAAGARAPGSPLAPRLAAATVMTADAYYAAGKLPSSAAALREALAIYDRAYGPDTLEAGDVQITLAQTLRDQGRLDESEVAARAAVRIRARGGQTPSLALAQAVLTDVLTRRGHTAEAIALGEQAVALARATMAPTRATLQVVIQVLADAYDADGQLPRALALYDDTLATFAREGIRNFNTFTGLGIRANLLRRMNRCGEALAGLHEAEALARKLQGDAGHSVGLALRVEGLCLDQLGRRDAAIAVLERGLAFETPEGDELEQAQLARGVLGRLLVTTGRDPARGHQLVETALAALHSYAWKDPIIASLDAWQASQASATRR
jgi:tetratricopeptide (TPR) repeat protein/predicted Ser/Thr protein kinase